MNHKLRENVMTLIEVFQCAILELSAKLEDEKDSLSDKDIESTQYVVGMAQISSVNLQQVAERGAEFYEADKEKVDRLISEAVTFADALKAEGYGLSSEC